MVEDPDVRPHPRVDVAADLDHDLRVVDLDGPLAAPDDMPKFHAGDSCGVPWTLCRKASLLTKRIG
jgi:hypothetical protein